MDFSTKIYRGVSQQQQKNQGMKKKVEHSVYFVCLTPVNNSNSERVSFCTAWKNHIYPGAKKCKCWYLDQKCFFKEFFSIHFLKKDWNSSMSSCSIFEIGILRQKRFTFSLSKESFKKAQLIQKSSTVQKYIFKNQKRPSKIIMAFHTSMIKVKKKSKRYEIEKKENSLPFLGT